VMTGNPESKPYIAVRFLVLNTFQWSAVFIICNNVKHYGRSKHSAKIDQAIAPC
jgi:hypothetical protein